MNTKLIILALLCLVLSSCGYVQYNPEVKRYEKIIPIRRYKYIDVPVYVPTYHHLRYSRRYGRYGRFYNSKYYCNRTGRFF